MFAEVLERLAGRLAVVTIATTVPVAGIACRGPENCACVVGAYAAVARGTNVVPPATDTAARAVVTIVAPPSAGTVAWTYTISTTPSGSVDSVALYQGDSGDTLPAAAAAVLCANAGVTRARPCTGATGSGQAVLVAPATTIINLIRIYRMQVVFFTTAAQKVAGGAMRGTVYPTE